MKTDEDVFQLRIKCDDAVTKIKEKMTCTDLADRLTLTIISGLKKILPCTTTCTN